MQDDLLAIGGYLAEFDLSFQQGIHARCRIALKIKILSGFEALPPGCLYDPLELICAETLKQGDCLDDLYFRTLQCAPRYRLNDFQGSQVVLEELFRHPARLRNQIDRDGQVPIRSDAHEQVVGSFAGFRRHIG